MITRAFDDAQPLPPRPAFVKVGAHYVRPELVEAISPDAIGGGSLLYVRAAGVIPSSESPEHIARMLTRALDDNPVFPHQTCPHCGAEHMPTCKEVPGVGQVQ